MSEELDAYGHPRYDPDWLGRECITCHERPPVHCFEGPDPDGSMAGVALWCDACWEDRKRWSAAIRAARLEVARHGYVLSVKCRRLLEELIANGDLADADLATLRGHGAAWFGRWWGIGRVTVAELERLLS
jgi:hypothetical protein